MQAASVGAHAPRAPPTDREKKLMDVLLDAADARVAPLLACVKGWPLEAQADLANWRAVLLKLHRLLLAALQQCPRLLLVETELEKTQQPIAVQTEQELAELVFEILKFSAFLLENAANKAVYPSAEPVMALLAARNERVVAEATKVVAMLALPPQVHRYAADPTSFVDPAASRNSLLRRRLLVVAQGRGTPKNSLEVVDYLNTTGPDAARDEDFQFYSSEQEGDEDAAARVVNVAIPPYEEIVGASTTPAEAACAAATACERLIQQYNIPKRLHFRLFTQVRACYAARSPLARENLVVERLYALLALFSLFSDAWDVTNYVEQHPELTRGVVELIRVESIERVPVRVRVTALLVLTALVNDRVGRAGGMGVLGRQSNVLQALGVVKGTPHGVFPSLVRFCMAELGDVSALSSTATTSGSPLPTALASETADTDMDMSLAVAFVQATTDLLSPQEAEVVSAPPFRSVSSGNVQEAKLCWMEAVLGLLTTVVAIQSGAAVLTENGIVPALLHVLTIPSVSTFHMAVTTQCVQALEITVSSHSAAAALYRDLNGVGILVDRLKLESASIVGGKRTPTSSANSETKTVLLLAILASLSMSFHSQGVMSAGATSRAIREGSALNKVLLQLLSNVDVFGPVVFAQAAVVVSDVINNDPSSVNHVHAAGLADAFLKTLTRWDIAELYPSRILLPPSSELLTAVPTVLNALCLTTTHAEKVAKYEPLMHLLDVFALPQYTEDEAKDYCFQGDTAAAVGAGIFELMRHVPSFQNAAIQAAVHALKKVIRFGEESKQTLTSSAQHVSEDKDHNILIRMTTHVADLLEPLLSKSEHAAYFADLGGIRLLLALYQLILPSTSSFLDGALPSKKATRAGSPQSSLAHNPAVHSITLALRSYASQQPTNLLAAIVKELSSQMDSLQRARANVGLPWYLSESGEGAEGVLSSLPDIDLAKLITAEDNSSVANTSADKVMVAGEYLRVLAVLEWLASVLIWTLETAHTHMQSRRWFTDFTTPSTQHVMARLFRVDRSVQFERASLAALHQKKRKEKSKESKEMKVAGDEADTSMELTSGTGEDKTNSVEAELSKSSRGAGLWKMGSLLLLRFSLSMRGLLTAYGKVFLSAPMQHRRGDDIVVPLAPHARKLARTVTQILEGHLLYVVSVNRATQIDTFVQQYYLTFLLETISVVLFEVKKKQANTLLLVELMKPLCDISEMQTQTKPPQSPRVAPASIEDVPMIQEGEGDAAKSGKTIATCAGAQITASNLMDVVMNIIERFFAVCVEGEREQSSNSGADDVVKPSQMALTSFHIAASVLRKLANLEGLSASPLTAALLTSDEAGESDEAPFEPRKLTAQLHGMCVRALLSVWRHPKFAYSPVDSCLAEVMPIAVTILKNRMDNDDEAAGSDGEGELSGSGRRQGLGFSRGNRERNSSTELYNEALSLRRALFGGTRGTGSSGSSRHQSFVPDTEIVDSLVSMGFQQSRVERALRQIQVNNVELAMEWILGHPEDEGEDDQHDEADDEDVAAGDAALRREKEAADEKKLEEDLQALYISLRDSFESVCFQILRVQADKKRQDAAKRQAPDVAQAEASSNFYPSQNLVKAIAEYFSFLCSRSDEDRDLVIQRLNAAVLDYFHEDEEGGDEYLTMMAHLLALVLQLNSDAWTVMQLQSPSCIDKLVAFVSSAGTNKDGSLKPSCTPILLVLDAAVAGKATKRLSTSPSSTVDDALVGSEAKINNEPNEGSRQSMNQGEDSAFEQQLVSICLQILKQASLAVPPASSTMADNKTLAHAIWQLLSRLTLKYDLASYFSAHGGLDAILDIPEGLFFVGYQELTSTLLSQALESPEVLEHMMEDKIRRAITKLSTRFGAPSQMRITPRALLTEVAPFAARNEAVFLRAFQNSVRVKKTESGRTYILPIPKKSDGSDAPPPGQPVDQPNVSLESGTSGAKTPHKLPKDHKHHAHVIVYKIIGRIRKLWGEEKSVKKQHEAHKTPGNETGLVSAGLCVGVYLQLLVHLITYFPACATVLAKAKDEAGAHGERGSFIRLVLCEFLPSRELCRFAASRKTLKEDGLYGNSRLGSGDSEQLLSDVKTFVESRTRMRVYNAHRLLVSIGGHSGEGSKCIILELVRLLQEWPQCNNHASKCDDLSVRDEHALSSLHAWSGLIMSILWPKGTSKGFAWDKVVLGGGLKGKHSFVTLLAEALRKINLTHPLAHATCTMLLRPISTLTRSFVTHRVRRLLKKRNHATVSGSIESAEGSANNPDEEASSTIPASAAIVSTSSESNRETSSSRDNVMEVDTETRESTNNAGPGFYPLREEDDDDVPMRSPLSGMDDHDMHGDDEDDDHSDDHSDRSSVSDHSTDDGEGEEDEEDENDDDDDDDDDDEDDDDDDDDDDDEDEDEDEFEEHQHLHMSRRTGGHGSSRRTSSNRLWGSLDSELSILDALDEVDEEEFSYLNMLDDEAFLAEEQRRRARLAAARNARPGNGTSDVGQQAGSSEDRLVESMRDALGLYNDGGGVSTSYSTGQTLVLTFGDIEDEEVEGENQAEVATTRGRVGSGGGFGNSLGSQSRYGGGAGSVVSSSLLQYIEELPDMLDDDFLFESFDAGGRGDRSRRDRQLGRSGGIDQFTPNATTHPLLRTSGRGDASLLDSNGLVRNPGRLTLPRHSTLLRELQELTDQVQTQLPLGGSRSRLAIGRDLLQRGGGGSRGRPPSRINRLSAVSNLLSEFSLDIPNSLPSRHQRLSLRRGDRDIFGDVFVGVDLSRGLGSRAGDVIGGSASNSTMWGSSSGGRAVDIRSVASRLEQQITRICADNDEPPVSAGRRDREASSQRREDVDDIMEESSAVGTPRSGEHTASDPRAVDDAVESDAQPDASENSDRMERHDAATDAASVLELTSTLGESSLLRSPPESDVDVDIVEAEAETPSERQEASPAAASNPAATSILDSALPPPAPISLPAEASSTTASATSNSMMNFTLDLSGFGATSTQSTTASDATNQARAVEEESKTEELPPTETQAVSVEAAAAQELSVESFDQQEGQQVYQCPEGMDAEVFASLPPDMQAEIVAQNAPAVAESTSARSDTATAGGGGGSESMSQLDLDMANSSFDRETLEALPPDIRAEVLENERREREAAARAETADTSRAQEMDNASFVASLAPELREEILVTCDDAFLQTLPSQVRAEAMVLRERAAFRSTYRERDRGTEGRGGGEGDMDELFNRPTLRRMLTSQTPETGSGRRRSRMYDELGGGRRSSRREYRQGAGSTKAHQGLLRVEKDEEEDARERIFDDRCVRGLLRLLFMTQSVIQNRVFQRLLANICLYPLTRCSVRRNLLRVISLPLAKPLVPGDERDDDDDGSGKIQFPPSSMYGCGIDGNRSIGGSAVPTEVVNRMLHVLVSLAKYNPRFTVEMLQPHGMRRQISVKSDAVKMDPSSGECGVAVLIDLLALPVVYRNGTNLDALLELLELVLSPLERLHKPRTDDEEKKEGEEGEAATPEPGDEWVAVPAVELDEVRMGEIVAVLAMDLCTNQMQERTLAVLKLLNHVPGNRELVIRAVVRHASKLARVERYKGDNASAETTGYESSAVLPSAQDELKLLRLLHSLSDVCESTAEFTECCQTIGLDPLWDALSVSLTEARAKGGLDDQDIGAPGASATQASSTVGSESQVAAASDDAEGTVIEGKSAGASCAMAALLARFLPMVEAFFVVNARDAASMSLRVPDSSEREEAVVAALRVGGFDGADATALMGTDEQKASPKSVLKRSSSVLSSVSIEAGETIRLANFVESNRVLLNLLVREKPSLLDTSLAALIKISRCRAYLAFDNKRTYFHSAMKRLRQTALRNHGGGSSSVRIPVRREHIFEDSYYALRMRSGTELRRKLHISFTGEEGIDAGGVTREWYMILAREMFNPNYVLFTSAADSPTFQPNPLSYVNKDHLSYFEFVGKVLGKAVADGQLLDAHFTRSFYKHILQLPISYHDMEAIDPEYYRNLHSILDNSIADLGLELTFSAEQSNFGKFEVVDLIPNGRNVVVTDENKMEYVKLVTHHRMATGIRQQIDSFLKGFHQLVPPEMIAIFNENELELLISGMPEIDIDDLKANTEYANYKPTDSVIRWFWNVLYSFTHEERALFLQFVTGTSKVPLEGFKALEGMRGTQKFNIHKAFGNNSALPSAHTCFNQLDLPEYESEEKLKQCLLLAIREGSEGFGFG
ncbi:E3 ubiquitin-protein ligase [Phytophthora fragariae]|uniref:HECT-type E3 ubiquitin transferase n=1 Tax=Phytophthora fragariae TaxID=53985 RepID=A0A6A3ZVN6_9STRA|nr:E3 ubiquitin-protein ligase [Phytophthora fragariae]KAE9220902.1 E3 ubiquitin-protein ligase [Phytophthora fragariae]KAE9242941.1 E3 ubiquitin-protein ligase [Phytophthora fragariae]KAE9318580.1 E3 ubiquitin-protein ligase [Phytophthora fragariae]